MRLRYKGEYPGQDLRTGTNCIPGEVYDFPDDVAKELIASGQFEQVVTEDVAGGE